MTQRNITNTPSECRYQCPYWGQIYLLRFQVQPVEVGIVIHMFQGRRILAQQNQVACIHQRLYANPLTPGSKVLDSFNFRATLPYQGCIVSLNRKLEKGKSALIPGSHLEYARGQHPKWLQACYHYPCNCFCLALGFCCCLFFKSVFLCGTSLAVLAL